MPQPQHPQPHSHHEPSGHLHPGHEGPHPQYEVLHQVKSMESDGRGGFEPHFTVHYRTPEGVESYVKLPASHYTPRNVHDQIAHEMSLIQRTHQLGRGEPPPHEHELGAGA